MFMFVFSVILISLVGLFLQVVQALAMTFSLQQIGVGEQVRIWHNMVYDYACQGGLNPAQTITMNEADPLGHAATVRAAVKKMREDEGVNYSNMIDWDSIIFQTSYGGATSVRTVVTWVDPTRSSTSYGGVSPQEVGRQLRKTARRNHMFGRVNGGEIHLHVKDRDLEQDIVISVSGTGIPEGADALVSAADCQ
jgi:hypothetical protein